ncbi:LysR family transcriptional regulator [Ciceribacter sp. RN22]|uniref:LysR family transcriptional regulator n=1 Tax=Ciceribacter sp. RN22 TaxID=2954932 RepID=UPI0020932E61|nr:LysR family transcriptional regulator [Ciceribacter sp. RN22]MCO6178779.1 LysR family transcriptional regulator [Ciceribacter sp. RN22]
MKRPITSLPALECFRAAAAVESISKAAEKLNLTHGAVSRAVRLLEGDIGTALFTRRNRAVFLTDEGRRLAQAVTHGLGHIEAAIRDIRAEQANAPVTVSCEPTLMMRWLIPRIPDLKRMHPQADIRLVAGGGPVTLGEGIDLAIRRDDFLLPAAYAAEPLFCEWVGPVCRPDLHERFFDNGHLRPGAPLLHSRTRMSAWQSWAGLTGTPLGGHPDLAFEHFYFSLQAAIAGLGVAIGPWHLVRDDLSAGLLSSPAGFLKDGSRYVLLSPGNGQASQAQTVFRDWLTQLAVAEPGPSSGE